MFPVFLRPRGSKKAILASPSGESRLNVFKASIRELFISPRPLVTTGPLAGGVLLSTPDCVTGAFARTRSAHYFRGFVIGDDGFAVSSDGGLVSCVVSNADVATSPSLEEDVFVGGSDSFSVAAVDAEGPRGACFGNAGMIG